MLTKTVTDPQIKTFEVIQGDEKVYRYLDKIEKVSEYHSGSITREEMIQTISIHVEKGFNMTETCRNLFIHRNTLKYRLQRMSDIMGLDITIPLNALLIYTAIQKRKAVKEEVVCNTFPLPRPLTNLMTTRVSIASVSFTGVG